MKTSKLPNSNNTFKSGKTKQESSGDDFDVFGKDLNLLLELSHNKEIPDLIVMFGYFIRTYGLLVQGLFRVSGNKTRMDDIKSSYLLTRTIELSIDDIHNITGLFKSFLRKIPNGLIPHTNLDEILRAVKVYKKNSNLSPIMNQLMNLPVPQYNLLKYTCSLLNIVSQCSGTNLMTSENLGVVFGPTFFIADEDVSHVGLQNSAATVFIQYYNDLFRVLAPVHTNLNQISDNTTDLSFASSSNNFMKSSNDQTTTIRFGQNLLVLNIPEENNDVRISNSMKDDEFNQMLDTGDSSFNITAVNGPQFSTALSAAVKMCITEHLLNPCLSDQSVVEISQSQMLKQRLISDMMLNPEVQNSSRDENIFGKINNNTSTIDPVNGRRRIIDEPIGLSFPRREVSSSILNKYLMNHESNQKYSDSIKKIESEIAIQTVHDRPNQVPQLDLSGLHEYQESKDNVNSRNFPKSKPKHEFINSDYSTLDCKKIPDTIPDVNQINPNRKKNRQFDEDQLIYNDCRPEKFVKSADDRYKTVESKIQNFKYEKERTSHSNWKNDEYDIDSLKYAKRKTISGAGDCVDAKINPSFTTENRGLGQRPVSALSESTIRMGLYSDSSRSNTLNTSVVGNHIAETLSPRELDSLKFTLDKISSHLHEDRVRDSRPDDLNSMTPLQIEMEKISMQKALLDFECKFGRNKHPSAIQLMKPLYERYRQVKKKLSYNVEHLGYECKTSATRTLDNRSKTVTNQSAWTTDKSVVDSLQLQNRQNLQKPHTIFMPSVHQFDSGDLTDNTNSQNPLDNNVRPINDNKPKVPEHQKRNLFQYRKMSTENDANNNRTSVINIEDQKSELQRLLREKRELQKILKEFEYNFEKDTNRKVEKNDRLPMEQEYSRYKAIKNRIKELNEHLSC